MERDISRDVKKRVGEEKFKPTLFLFLTHLGEWAYKLIGTFAH